MDSNEKKKNKRNEKWRKYMFAKSKHSNAEEQPIEQNYAK